MIMETGSQMMQALYTGMDAHIMRVHVANTENPFTIRNNAGDEVLDVYKDGTLDCNM